MLILLMGEVGPGKVEKTPCSAPAELDSKHHAESKPKLLLSTEKVHFCLMGANLTLCSAPQLIQVPDSCRMLEGRW